MVLKWSKIPMFLFITIKCIKIKHLFGNYFGRCANRVIQGKKYTSYCSAGSPYDLLWQISKLTRLKSERKAVVIHQRMKKNLHASRQIFKMTSFLWIQQPIRNMQRILKNTMDCKNCSPLSIYLGFAIATLWNSM